MNRPMLEAAYRGVLDRVMLEQLDEAWDLKCESKNHGHSPHVGPAAFLQIGPCEHTTGFRCAGIVVTYDFERLRCSVCGTRAGLDGYKFIPLAEVSS